MSKNPGLVGNPIFDTGVYCRSTFLCTARGSAYRCFSKVHGSVFRDTVTDEVRGSADALPGVRDIVCGYWSNS